MQKNLTLGIMVASLLMFAACDMGSKKADSASAAKEGSAPSGEVLVTIGGKPAITVKEFDEYYEQMLEQQPQLKSFAQFMPDLKQNVFNSMVGQKLIEHWAEEKKIDQMKDYQTDYDSALENIKRALAFKYFQLEHPVNVSDAEVKKFYDEHKDTMYAQAAAGVSAIGVSFDNEAKARAFLVKAQAPKADITKLAQAENLAARNFGRVNATSHHVDKALLDKILAINRFPSVQLVKVNNTWWVIEAKNKEEAKYFPFDQAKEDARQKLQNKQMGEMFEKEIAKLKAEYGVVENKSFFEKKEEAKTETAAVTQPAEAQEAEAAQPVAKPAVA